jgi:hypothetical protein
LAFVFQGLESTYYLKGPCNYFQRPFLGPASLILDIGGNKNIHDLCAVLASKTFSVSGYSRPEADLEDASLESFLGEEGGPTVT